MSARGIKGDAARSQGTNLVVGWSLVRLGLAWAVVAAAGVILAALYLLWAYQRVFHGEPDEANQSFRELSVREGLVLLPMLAAIFFCGVYPKAMLDRIEPSVKALLAHVEEQTGYEEPIPVAVPVSEPEHAKDKEHAKDTEHAEETEHKEGE